MTANVAKSFSEMSGPELVIAFNEMVNSQLGKELGAKAVQRFADRESGLKRIEALASSIRARVGGLKRVEDEEPQQAPPKVKTTTPSEPAVAPQNDEDEMATKAKAAKTAVKRSAVQAAAPAPRTKAGQALAAFGARESSNRERLLTRLTESINKQVPLVELIKATYGNQKEENKGPLGMVLKGVQIMIDKGKLPYKLIKEKADGEISYGLHEK